MQVFAHDGECRYSGSWSTITSARSFDAAFFSPPRIGGAGDVATHAIHYTTGATAALTVGETLTGGTSGGTCKLVKRVIDNGGTAGSSDAGWLFVCALTGALTTETLTGGTSTGTVASQGAPQPVAQTTPKACLLTCETADVRFCLDGNPASVTSGAGMTHLLQYGQSYVARGHENIDRFSAINAVASSGSVIKYSLFY